MGLGHYTPNVSAKCVHLWVSEHADEQISVIIIILNHLALKKTWKQILWA